MIKQIVLYIYSQVLNPVYGPVIDPIYCLSVRIIIISYHPKQLQRFGSHPNLKINLKFFGCESFSLFRGFREKIAVLRGVFFLKIVAMGPPPVQCDNGRIVPSAAAVVNSAFFQVDPPLKALCNRRNKYFEMNKNIHDWK